MNELFVIGQMTISAALFYSCFCRLVMTNVYTIREVRWALWYEAVASALVFMAPVLPMFVLELDWRPGTTPLWVWMEMLLAATLVQIVRARYWVGGVRETLQRNP